MAVQTAENLGAKVQGLVCKGFMVYGQGCGVHSNDHQDFDQGAVLTNLTNLSKREFDEFDKFVNKGANLPKGDKFDMKGIYPENANDDGTVRGAERHVREGVRQVRRHHREHRLHPHNIQQTCGSFAQLLTAVDRILHI